MRPEPPRPTNRDAEPFEIDTTVAQPARVQSYLAGGDAYFAVDRELGEYIIGSSPGGGDPGPDADIGRGGARAVLAFTARAVRYLVGRAGVRQLLCFGTTVPLLDSVHVVAQQLAPEARVVYVGRDPVVLAHAHTVHSSTPESATAYVNGGLRDLDEVLRQAAKTLDLAQPVALLLIGVLHLVSDERDPHRMVRSLMESVPSGSYLVVAHPTHDFWPERSSAITERLREAMQRPWVPRPRAEVSRFFDGLEPVEGGLVHIDRWGRPDDEASTPAGELLDVYGGVARKR